jgi:hypothetical protein
MRMIVTVTMILLAVTAAPLCIYRSREKAASPSNSGDRTSTPPTLVSRQLVSDTIIRDVPEANSESSNNVISESDPFRLKQSVIGVPAPQPPSAPDQDLILTGVIGDFGSGSSATFRIAEAGGSYSHFTLRENEQNEWLEIRAIDVQNKVVCAVLKRPCIRIRSVGAEVLLSFKTHGQSNL